MFSHYCHCYDTFCWIHRNVSASGLFSLENAALFLDSKKQKTNNRGRFRNVSGILYGTLKLLIIFAWSLTLKFYVYSIETTMHLYAKVQPFGVLANGMFQMFVKLARYQICFKEIQNSTYYHWICFIWSTNFSLLF